MARDVTIEVNGAPHAVPEGITLAAALARLGITRLRTSVSGAPRGPLCGMGSCFECRVTVDGRAHQRACLIACTGGMTVSTAALAGAMRRRGQEPAAAVAMHDAGTLEADVAVIGGGPAGIAAATRAAEAGRRVVVVDQGLKPGGQVWRHVDRRTLPGEARRWLARVERAGVQWLAGATVHDLDPARGLVVTAGDRRLVVRAGAVVLATGARELFLPFPGWTLPNVAGVGGAQALLKAGADMAGWRVAIAGSGPLLLPVAALFSRSARIVAVAEQAPFGRLARFVASLRAHPGKLAQAARYRLEFVDTRYRAGTWVTRAEGDGRVQAVTFTDGRRAWTEACDFLACGYGLVPNVELARIVGCAVEDGVVVVDDLQRTTVPGVLAAGEPTGIAGETSALVQGEIAGLAAAGRADAVTGRLRRARDAWRGFGARLAEAFAPRDELRALAEPETVVCRCEDVRYRRLDPAWTGRQAKLYSRLGMGPCQGAVCGPACGVLFGWPAGAARPPVGAPPVEGWL